MGGFEDFGGCFGDEGRWVFTWFPDDIHFFGVFPGVLEFAFDAAGEAGDDFAAFADEFGDEADDHVGLVDEFEVAHVDLAVDVAGDVEDFAGTHFDGFEFVFDASELVGLVVEEVLAFFGGVEGTVEEEFFIDITWIECNEVFGELGAEGVDLGHDIGHVDDMGHGEGGVDFFHFWSADELEECFDCLCVSASGDDVELGAGHGLAHEFGGEDFFFAPDHAVFEGCVDIVGSVEALVDDFDVIDETDEEVWLEFGDLVEVECGEEAVAPAEGGVGVDDHVSLIA